MAIVLTAFALTLVAIGSIAQEYPSFGDLPQPEPAPETPGLDYDPPTSEAPAQQEAPAIYSHTEDAGPDQTAFVAGSRLSDRAFVWGPSLHSASGGPIEAKAYLSRDDSLFVTFAQNQPDGVYLVWVGNDGGWAAPFRLNAPTPWWCGPDQVAAGEPTRIFGRNLARRPDHAQAFVYLAQPGTEGHWAETGRVGKYAVGFRVPADLAAGEYQVWVHAGMGGEYGWGGPVPLTVMPPESETKRTVAPEGRTREAIEATIAQMGEAGGTIELGAGVYELDGTVTLRDNITLRGRGMGETVLQLSGTPGLKFTRLGGGWALAPQGVHTPGDTLVYEIDVPEQGEYIVWLRYGCNNSPWNVERMDERTQLQVDDGEPVLLKNLPNTESFAVEAWSRTATMHLPAGKRRLSWRNNEGGGLSLDAFVFTRDESFSPGAADRIEQAPGLIIVQAEDVVEMQTKEARLPGQTSAVVHMAGDGSGISDLSIMGSQQATLGIHVRSPDHPSYLHAVRIENVEIADIGGKHAENCGVLIEHADHVAIKDCEITARAPVFMRGLKQGQITGNRLRSVTRIGGNAEAALLGRNDVLRETIIEDNRLLSPYSAGGPTQRRMIWVSTGEGSVDNNYFARNHSEGQQFGGTAGTDQNVGEMILFEANMRMAYCGPPAAGDGSSVTVGEQAFLPPLTDEGSGEPIASEYFITVCSGPGLGQTRRVVGREGRTFRIERPWRVAPTADSLILITTLFARNIVHENETINGMTGIQLWIGCVENIVADNYVARQRKPGLFLYSTCTLSEPVMERTWNRGIGVFYYNHVEGNRIEETTDGILLTARNYAELPTIDWPRTLGTVLRHNTCVRSRSHGVNIVGDHTKAGAEADERSIIGTVVEFNSMRDQPVAYRANDLTRATAFRRNHAYFWHTWTPETNPVAYDVVGAADLFVEANTTEGMNGGGDERIIERLTEPQE